MNREIEANPESLNILPDKFHYGLNLLDLKTEKPNSFAQKSNETKEVSEKITATTSANDIVNASSAYEKWMGDHIKVVPEDLAKKHEEMSSEPFKFLRASYFRWAEKFPELLPELQDAPTVNSVADAHFENFGTWTNSKGQMVWGVNDFDESYPLPYTNDLLRLLTSVNLLKQHGDLEVGLEQAVSQVLAGYKQSLQDGGKPFILDDKSETLSRLAEQAHPNAEKFWKKLDKQISARPANDLSKEELDALKSVLPEDVQISQMKIGSRQAGLGSLGRERYAAIGQVSGQTVSAEIKALLPSANYFVTGNPYSKSHYAETLQQAVREPDPMQRVQDKWAVRGLSPDRYKIEVEDLANIEDESSILWSMGYELANIHQGTKNAAAQILADLETRNSGWLVDAVTKMTEITKTDFEDWKNRKLLNEQLQRTPAPPQESYASCFVI